MCTLTWLLEQDGYRIFFNRDEERSRRPALPPVVDRRGEVRFIAPKDGEHGGTWVAVNERGISLCLLNRFETVGVVPEREAVSRGLLVLDLSDAGSPGEVRRRLHRTDLSRYRPFSLVVFGVGVPPSVIHYDARRVFTEPVDPGRMPLVSSGFDLDGVECARRAELERVREARNGLDSAALERYHASHAPIRGPYSPCMHREEAATVSFSRIEVTPEVVRFFYCPRAPCRGGISGPFELARTPAGKS